MAFALRLIGYVGGGGVLLALVNPPAGPVRWFATIVAILVSAYIDTLIGYARGDAPRRRGSEGVVRMDAYRAGRHSGGAHGHGKSERRVPRHLYDTTQQAEAEGLLSLLRAKGLHPIMVTRRSVGNPAPVVYEVRLPEPELPRAKPLMSQYISRRSAPLN